MKSFASLAALVAVVAAQDLPVPAGDFTIGAWNPPSGFVGTGINANGGAFFIGKEPNTTCPTIEGLDCTAFPGSSTVLTGGNGTLSLDVAVPGGQQVFVDPTGALGYTPPHSASMPTGSLTTGFLRFRSQAGGAPTPMNFNGNIFRACPVADETDVYQIYAAAVGDACEGAVSFQLRTYPGASLNAWEY